MESLFRRSRVAAVAALWLTALAIARADITRIDPLARPNTKLGPRHVLALDVTLMGLPQRELCGEFPVDRDGFVQLFIHTSPLPRLKVAGMTADEVRAKVEAMVRPYYRAEPEVRTAIAHIHRITVNLEGGTLRTGPVIVPDGARLSDLLIDVGVLPNADRSNVIVVRAERGERVVLRANFQKVVEAGDVDPRNDPPLVHGDRITLDIRAPRVEPMTFSVGGEVKRPGTFAFIPGMTVRDALVEALGLLDTADGKRLTVKRYGEEKFISIDADAAMRRVPTEDIPLRPNDVLFAVPKDTGRKISVLGAVVRQGTFEFRQPIKISQALAMAGGTVKDADVRSVIVMQGMLSDPASAKAIKVDLDKIAKGQQDDILLYSGDVVQVAAKKKGLPPILEAASWLLRFILF